MEKKLKSWQGWLLFGGTMVVVFVLGMIAASVNERHAEVTSVMNNKKTEITGIEARNDKFESNIHVSTRLGRLRRIRVSRVYTTGIRRSMCWRLVRKW